MPSLFNTSVHFQHILDKNLENAPFTKKIYTYKNIDAANFK